MLEKAANKSRGLLFGLLVNCIFSTDTEENCPLSDLRSALSLEEKYDFVMQLGDDEVQNILLQHEECYENRLTGSIRNS